MTQLKTPAGDVDGVYLVDTASGLPFGADKPLTTTDSLGGTRTYNFANNIRVAVGAASTAEAALPTLSASREIMVHASARCFIRFGASGLAAASAGAGQLILEAGERFHFRLAAASTHYRVIRDTADGFLTLTAVL